MVFKFPQTLGDVLMNQTGMTIEEALMKSNYPNNVRVKADKIMLDGRSFKHLDIPQVIYWQKKIYHFKTMIKKKTYKDISDLKRIVAATFHLTMPFNKT